MDAPVDQSPPARLAAARVPDFFIVGHPKSGTTALYEMLRRHPQIYMPDLKEPWFFASDLRPRFQPVRQAPTPQSLPKYLALFAAAGPGQRLGEASSTYLLSRAAAAGIAEVAPAARIVAVLREPASFLRSLHQQLLLTHAESKKRLRTAIALEPARREGRRVPRGSHRPQMLMYSEHVRYVEQLRRYDAVFPREQMLVLVYDDFRADNEGTVRTVRRFLGVDEQPAVEVLDANRTVASMRSQRLDDLVNRVSVGRGPVSRAVKGTVKALMPAQARRSALGAAQSRLVNRAPRPPEEDVMLALRQRFKGEVQALSEYLDRDLLALWGYESLA